MEDFITTVISWLPESWGIYIAAIISALVAVCALLCTFLSAPTDSSGTFYKGFYTAVQWIALNLGKAKNAQDVPATETQTTNEQN